MLRNALHVAVGKQNFDTELVSNIIFNLKHGKAAGTDRLSAEH